MKKKNLIFIILVLAIFLVNNLILASGIDWSYYSVKEVKKIISQGINLNQQDSYGKTPLIWAAMFNDDPQVIELLVESGANINTKGNDGLTPLMYAAKYNRNLSVIEKLLDKGADIYLRSDIKGRTALMFAAEKNSHQVVRALIERGARVNYTDFNGVTPLMIATKNNNVQVVDTLIRAKANLNVRDRQGQTPLMWAAKFSQDQKIIFNLLNSGADPKLVDNQGHNAFDYLKDNIQIYTSNNQEVYYRLKSYFDPQLKKEKSDQIKAKLPSKKIETNSLNDKESKDKLLIRKNEVVGAITYNGFTYTIASNGEEVDLSQIIESLSNQEVKEVTDKFRSSLGGYISGYYWLNNYLGIEAGLDMVTNSYSTKEEINSNEIKQRLIGPYSKVNYQFNNRIKLSAGAGYYLYLIDKIRVNSLALTEGTIVIGSGLGILLGGEINYPIIGDLAIIGGMNYRVANISINQVYDSTVGKLVNFEEETIIDMSGLRFNTGISYRF